ncbi:MAG: CPBP family intramembrane metalloprotease [Lachnospiraceae bacterium]|nr:CPBP family intramembrane metalloprotease [Lachnospiraceae bacterium]
MKINTFEKERDYTTYPRKFVSYRWFKPLLTGILFMIFYYIFSFTLIVIGGIVSGDFAAFFEQISGGYDTLSVYSVPGILASLAPVASMIPALYLASKIVGDRPFSSYSSARGGWNWKIFFRMLLVAGVTVGIPNIVMILLTVERTSANHFSLLTFILLTILGPMQCIAEEYGFRGLLMQSIGSWFRLPILAIILQMVVFASQHPYNAIGVASIVVSGLTFGFVAWYTNGLETGAAEHVMNNMTIFYLSGLGFDKAIATEVAPSDLIQTIICDAAFIACVIILDRKFHWFGEIKRDDITPFNDRINARKKVTVEQPAATSEQSAAPADQDVKPAE